MVNSEGEYIPPKGNENMDRPYTILQYEQGNSDEHLLFCGHDITLPPKSQKKKQLGGE